MNVLNATLMILLSINFVLLTMLKVKKNKYTFGYVGVFHQQSPCTWSLPCLYEQVHFEQNMKDFYISQTPPSENLDLRAQTHWRYWTLRQSLPWDAWGRNYWSNPVVEIITDLLPVKRDNPGRPVIPISIGMVDFLEALCDFGSSVNIVPKPTDQTLSFPKGILKNFCVRVGTLYAPADFVVIETGLMRGHPS